MMGFRTRRWVVRLIRLALLFALVVAAVGAGTPSAAGPQPLIAFATGGEGVTGVLDIGVARADGSGFANITRDDPGGNYPVWTSDGRALVVSTYDDFTGKTGLWRIGANGGERRRLPGGEDDAPSPDGHLVAILARSGIVLRDETGRLVRRLPFRLRRLYGYDAPPLWSPDGHYLALAMSDEDGEHGRTWLLRTDGRGRARLLSRTDYEFPIAFSPDSHRLLASGPFVVSVESGARHRLRGGIAHAWDASWSPDGRQFAYVAHAGGVYVTDADGGSGRLVARTTSKRRDLGNMWLAWSPRGTAIAFSERAGLYLTHASGGSRRRLTDVCSVCALSWRPNGEEIAFSRHGEVFAVTLAGHLRAITGPRLWADSPAWAPDRSLVAFTAGTEELTNAKTLGIYVVRPGGTGLRRLGRGYGPQWSPDSRHLVYVDPVRSPDAESLGQSRAGAIVVASLDGSTRTVALGTSPVWSPDGTTIAFVRYRFGPVYDPSSDKVYIGVVGSMLSLVGADGSAERVLLTSETAGGPLFKPRWAPDGSALAVSQQLRDPPEDAYTQLALVDPVTGAERLVPHDVGSDFRWSPDSLHILTVRGSEIGIVDLATTAYRTILAGGFQDNHDYVTLTDAVWSPDGSQIAYTRRVLAAKGPDTWDVWTMAADGSNSQRVTRTPGIEGALAWAP